MVGWHVPVDDEDNVVDDTDDVEEGKEEAEEAGSRIISSGGIPVGVGGVFWNAVGISLVYTGVGNASGIFVLTGLAPMT